MSVRRCCCPLCPDFCMSHGESHSPCTSAETALFYFVGEGSTVLLGDTAEALCYVAYPPQLSREPLACEWTYSDGNGDWSLEIISDTDAVLKWTDGVNTLVWVPRELLTTPECTNQFARNYHPLCSSVFEYDADHVDNNPPASGCSWNRCVCVTPANACCDSNNLREESMPDTLYATITFCFGTDPPDTIVIVLTWNSTTYIWEGNGTIGNGSLYLELRCNCGLDGGCGSPGFECYLLNYWHTGCGGNTEREVATDECTCDPFDADFVLSELGESCCDAGSTITWLATVTE